MTNARNLRNRMRGPVLGIAAQLLNAATNVATAFIASYVLDPQDFGTFVLAYAFVTIVVATGRGLIGSTLLAHLPAVDEPRSRELTRSALGFTLWSGLAATALLALIALAVPTLGWFVPWILVALYQDTGRFVLLARGRTGAALLLDVAWAVAQVAVLVAWTASGATITVGVAACAWGTGALAGAVLFAVRYAPRPSRPGPWVRTTRDVAGWFTATAVVGQVEVYVVLLIVGLLLTPADAGAIRAVQLIALQPAVVVLGSILVLATTVFARIPDGAPPAAFTRSATKVLLAVLPVALLIMLVVPLQFPLMSLVLPQYLPYSALVLPTALQAVVLALAVAPVAELRGRRQGRLVFGTQTLRIVLVVGSALIGLFGAGVDGVAWAQVVASVLSLLVMFVAAQRVRTRAPAVVA